MKRFPKFYLTMIVGLISLAPCLAADNPSSRLTSDKMYSPALGEEREFCVYLPENFDPTQTYPVIFATDGQIIASGDYKTIFDNLIKDKKIPPVVLIGTYSNEKTISSGMELRYYEYIENDIQEPETAGRFENHLKFFSREVRDSILSKYAIKPAEKVIFYGCSNGGDYGLTLYAKHQGLFTDYICLSPVGTEAKAFKPAKSSGTVTLYVGYGRKEAERPILGDNLKALGKKLSQLKQNAITVHVFDGGHDRKCWEQEFAAALTAALKQTPQ